MIARAASSLALALTLGAVGERRAAAEPSKRTSTLGWVRLAGADGCVATQPLARAVEARLGRAVFVSPSEADVSVEGRIERKGPGFVATLLLRDAEGKTLGSRSLERGSPSCADLTESLVLIVAVMIDPDAALRPPPPAPPPPPPPAPAPPPPTAPAPAAPAPEVRVERVYVPVPGPPAPPAVRVEGGLGGRVALGVVPGAGIAVAASGIVVPRGFIGLLVRAAYVFPSSAAAAPGAIPADGARVAFSHASLGSGLCPLAHVFGRVFLTACAEGELGLLLARPSYTSASGQAAASQARATLSGGASFGASLLVAGPLSVRLGTLVQVPLLREPFSTTLATGENYEVFRQSPVTFSGELGAGLRFP